MKRRHFLTAGLLAPLALQNPIFAANDYDPRDPAKVVCFAKDPRRPKATLWQLTNQKNPQMMGYVLRTASGQTVVFDGGWAHDAPYLVDLLQKECGGKVDAWFFSHAHIDHCGAFAEIQTKTPDDVDVKTLVWNFPPREWLDEHAKGSAPNTKIIFDGIAAFKGERHIVKPGENFKFGELEIECLNDFDLSITPNAINNSTIVYRLDVADKSILMLGDLGYEGGDRVLQLVDHAKLECEFCQMAHHGQQGVRRSFYEVVKPRRTLWCAPDWLWRNDSGAGDGSGPFKTCDTRVWCAELGVEDYFVMKDGVIKLTF